MFKIHQPLQLHVVCGNESFEMPFDPLFETTHKDTLPLVDKTLEVQKDTYTYIKTMYREFVHLNNQTTAAVLGELCKFTGLYMPSKQDDVFNFVLALLFVHLHEKNRAEWLRQLICLLDAQVVTLADDLNTYVTTLCNGLDIHAFCVYATSNTCKTLKHLCTLANNFTFHKHHMEDPVMARRMFRCMAKYFDNASFKYLMKCLKWHWNDVFDSEELVIALCRPNDHELLARWCTLYILHGKESVLLYAVQQKDVDIVRVLWDNGIEFNRKAYTWAVNNIRDSTAIAEMIQPKTLKTRVQDNLKKRIRELEDKVDRIEKRLRET